MPKTKLSFINAGRETHGYSHYLHAHNYSQKHPKKKKTKNLANPASKCLRV